VVIPVKITVAGNSVLVPSESRYIS
jgi:hypothetical protein